MIKLILTFIFCVFSFSFAEDVDVAAPAKDVTAIAAPITTKAATDISGDQEYSKTAGANKPKTIAEGKLADCTLKGSKCDPLAEGKVTDKKGSYTGKASSGSSNTPANTVEKEK